jgi:(p)ppGpp synthase/HD superfamily hydrolase
MSTLERAIAIAAEAHQGAQDKGGQPYILHPLRVMLAIDSPDERIVAVLHDVLEDTPWTADQLRKVGFSETVIQAVDALTKREGEEYMAYVSRAGANVVARSVKLADLADNMDAARLPSQTEENRARIERYKTAAALLEAENDSTSVGESTDNPGLLSEI